MEGEYFQLTAHARMRLRQRNIKDEWIERTIRHPDRTCPDPEDPELRHAYKRIHAASDQILRVVYNPEVSPVRIVTALFETKRKGGIR